MPEYVGQWKREQLEEIIKKGKNFKHLKMHGADFTGLDLERADFRFASCPYAKFDNCNAKYLNGEGGNFSFTSWNNSNLHRSNFKEANLQDADFSGVTDLMGITLTMDCRTWMHLKLSPGHWYGFLFYGLLMDPPTDEAKEKLQLMLGPEHYKTLRDLYATRRM